MPGQPTPRQPLPVGTRSILVLATSTGGLVLTAAGLWSLGSLLPAPPTRASDWASWLQEETMPTAVFSMARLAALALVTYLLASTALAVLCRLHGTARSISWSNRLLTSGQRRLLSAAMGVGLTIVSTATPVAGSTPAVMVAVDQPSPSPGAEPVTIADEAAPAGAPSGETMELLVPDSHADPDPTVTEARPAPVVADTHGPGPTPSATTSTWTIRPGDHLWAVSRSTLVDSGHEPTEYEVADYLHQIVVTNPEVLVVPDNPDLVYTGQVFVLPDLPQPGSH